MYPAPFRPEYGHQLFSCSKTFTSTAVGLAIMDNRLRLDDRLAAFFPELLPNYLAGGYNSPGFIDDDFRF